MTEGFASMRWTTRWLPCAWFALALLGWAPGAWADASGEREAHWRAGTAAFQDGIYAVAENELQDYLKLAVDRPQEASRAAEAVSMLARVMIAQNQTDDLLRFLKDNRWWMRHAAPGAIPFWRALSFYELHDPRSALRELDNFATDNPGSAYTPRALHLGAWCQLQIGNTNAALQAFADFDQRYRGTIEGAQNRLEWGQALIAAGRLDEADTRLAEVTNLTTDAATLAKGLYWRGRVLIEDKRWAEAAQVLQNLLTQEIPDPDLRAESGFALARARLELGDQKGAADALAQGLEQAQDRELQLSGSRRLGLLYLDMGRIDDGVALLRRFVSAAPTDTRAGEAQLALADALLQGGRQQEAFNAYQAYLESFTNATGVARAYKGRGWSLQAVGRYAESAASFEKAYALCTAPADREECLYKEGDADFANQQYKLAADAYTRMLAEFPEGDHSQSALYQLAQCQAMGGEPDQAEATYRRIAERYPREPLAEEALLRAAQLRDSLGQFAQAADGYSAVMTAFTNGVFTAEALLGRGRVRYRLAQYAEAFDDFTRLVTQFSAGAQVEEARYRLIMCQYLLGRDPQALDAGRTFLTQYPGSRFAPRVQYWLGKYAFNAGQFADAEKYFMDFYAGHPTDPDAEGALLWAARAAAHTEEYLRANEILTTLLKDYPQGAKVPEARYEQGLALAALAKFPEAILAFQEVVNRYPGSDLIPDTWLHLGDCQFMLGTEDAARFESAMAAYRAASTQPNAKVDLCLQAEYKIGRCLEKLNRPDDAIQQYYKNVVVRFLEARDRGEPQSETARTWFGRALRDTADILQERKQWRKVVSVLERALNAGVPDEAVLRDRIRDIRAQHWWLFY